MTDSQTDRHVLNQPDIRIKTDPRHQIIQISFQVNLDSKMVRWPPQILPAWPEQGVGRVQAVGMETVPCTP